MLIKCNINLYGSVLLYFSMQHIAIYSKGYDATIDYWYTSKRICQLYSSGNIAKVESSLHLVESCCNSSPSLCSIDLDNKDSQQIYKTESNLSYNGGWLVDEIQKHFLLHKSGPCNIDVVDGYSFKQEDFISKYAYAKPVIIKNASYNKAFQSLVHKDILLHNFGHTSVQLSSANSYSYEKVETTFMEYSNQYINGGVISYLANESFYLFGDNSNEDWFSLFQKYNIPKYFLPNHLPQLSFGVAGSGTGVPFHFHGPGFAETLFGRKRWFLSPPSSPPTFHPNQTTLHWLQHQYNNAKANLLECTLRPGELIYFPNHWWHATLNLDNTVFMSTFLSP